MKFKFLGMLTMATCFTTFVYGDRVNYRLLGEEAVTHCNRITRGEPSDEPQIKETLSLSILIPGGEVEERYTHKDAFSSFYSVLAEGFSDPYFRDFATTCLRIYGEYEGDPKKQIATHLLLECVKRKFDEHQKRLARLEQQKKEEKSRKPEPQEVSRAALDLFMHMDTSSASQYLQRLEEAERKAGISTDTSLGFLPMCDQPKAVF